MAKAIKKKPHTPGTGVKLVGSPKAFIDLLIEDSDGNEWAINELENEGPEHKQVFSALLLQRMDALVKEVEAATDSAFSVQPGAEVVNEKDGTILPFPFPATATKKSSSEDVVAAIAHSPNHELVAFTSLLQGIEWSIKALHGKKKAD